ncbi:LPXTG cell wall anchor domain-containing protein [Micromonospora sp. NPDC020750]|uniref:LPXTG cell wall anchor domain-containing protein n=1 Tax=unclassified Micromonospora TaxID=2617518 RepID=UPI0037995E11
MHTHRARRCLAGLAVTGMIVTASVGAPAAAAPPTADVKLYANNVIVAPDGPQKSVELRPLSDRPFGNYTVRLDRSAVAAVAEVTVASDWGDCTTQGEVITCEMADEGEPTSLFDVTVKARAGAEIGQQGTLAFTLTAPGVGTGTYRSTVVVGEGVDLATERELPLDGKLGERVDVPLTVANRGTKTVRGMVLYLSGSFGFTPSKRYKNCKYSSLILDDSNFACTFDDSLAPGEAVRVDSTFGGTIPADAWAPNVHYSWVAWFTPADWERSSLINSLGHKGTDEALKLVPVGGAQARALGQTDTDPMNNETGITLNVAGDNNRADVAAEGATVTGAVGATVPMTVGYLNNGPARVGPSGQKALTINATVTLPKGVTAVAVSNSCVDPSEKEWKPGKPGARIYSCSARGTIPRGERVKFEFKLRIDRAGSQTGTVRLQGFTSGGSPAKDLNPANDTAKITVKSTGGTGTGGGGGGGGTLPITGAATGLIAGLGGLLIAVGAGGYLLARRRRTRFVA